MKIVVAGEYNYTMYQEALMHGIQSCGHQAVRLVLPEGRLFHFGLQLRNSRSLLRCVAQEQPEVLFLYRVNSFFASTLRLLKWRYPKLCIMVYHNDDPFRGEFWRHVKNFHFLQSVRHADVTYVYRLVNIDEARHCGGRRVKLFMSHYDSRFDVVPLSADDFKKATDKVVFVGHYEPDGRVECLDALFRHGVNLHIYGPAHWADVFSEKQWPVDHCHACVFGDDYRRTINESSIALAFFSTVNRDDYTRRCFEIPVMGTMLVAPRTKSTQTIFTDREDVALYSNKDELLSLIDYYTAHPDERDRIAETAYHHMLEGGQSEQSRAQMVIDDVEAWRANSQP